MPPKRSKEALVLLINIAVRDQENSPVLDKAKYVARRIIEKKIFLRPKDEIGVILMGSSTTKNTLQIDHIEEFAQLQVPNWELVEQILSLKATDHSSNWVDTVYVAVDFLTENVIEKNTTKKIVILSDFNEDPEVMLQYQSDEIANKLTENKVQLLTIARDALDTRPENSLSASETLLNDVHKKIDGQHVTFESAMLDLRFYREPSVAPQPWYCSLELVDKEIPIVAYVKVSVAKTSAWSVAKDEEEIVPVAQHLNRQRSAHEENEIVAGYKFGEQFIPIGSEDEEDMVFKSGPKSYKIHSFANADEVGLQFWCDSSTRVVLPANEAAVKPFYSLVQAMDREKSVAIVRKVYRENCNPCMVALFPCINVPGEPWCLVEVELPFAEDQRPLEKTSIKSVVAKLSNEQSEAVDNLLDSFMLTDTEDSTADDSHFLPGCLPNPAVQHEWDMLAHRAINPDKPLPEMSETLKGVYEAPSVKEKSKPHLEKITALFQLQSIDPKAKEEDQANVDGAVNKQESNVDDVQTAAAKTEPLKNLENESFEEPALTLDPTDVDLDGMIAGM